VRTSAGSDPPTNFAAAFGHPIASDNAALRLVVRYLDIEHDGASFSAFVLAKRLAKAERMLADRRYAHLSIAQIAHESGFGDVSHFNRMFRRHYGVTPSDVREEAWRDSNTSW
jgi:AraC-like DNA-binding protein